MPEWRKAVQAMEALSHLNRYILGIAIPPTILSTEQDNLANINKHAHLKYGEKYIHPITLNMVDIEPNDRFRIHYTRETVDRIVKSIRSHLN